MVDLWVHFLEEREHYPVLALVDVILYDGERAYILVN